MVITVACPSCATSFPVDTNKVPEGGVNARCSECRAIFRVERPRESVVEHAAPLVPAVETAAAVEPQVAEPEVAEPQVAEPETEPAHAAYPEDALREALEQEAPEAEEPPPTSSMEEAESGPSGVEGASAGGYGLAATLEEVLEEEHEEAAGPEEQTAEAATGGWGALRELLEGADDVATEGAEVGVEEEAPVKEPTPDTGEVHAAGDVGETLAGDVVEEAHAPDAETFAEVPEAPEAEVETADTSAGGTEVVWDVDREVEEVSEQARSAASPGWFTFGRQDPDDKARRLARVLVSDMMMYNPERHDRALNNGTLKEDFEEEIRKSWREYVEQVGEEMATGTTYWADALNDLLAKGQQIF